MHRKIAILECEDAEKWKGYTELLWKEALREPGDQWTLYKACESQLPTLLEATQYDAIVVAGSHYSAYEDHDWIHQLLDLLRKLAEQGARIYGCCFGCQILARALGGSVGPNPDGKFVLTIEQVTPTGELQQYPKLQAAVQQALAEAAATAPSNSMLLDTAAADQGAFSADTTAAEAATELAGLNISPAAVAGDVSTKVNSTGSIIPMAAHIAGHATARAAAAANCFNLIESHGDQVLQLPHGATLLATSDTATNELWCWGSNVLASQFHVEFDEPLVLEKIWASLKDVGRLDAQEAEQSRQVLEAGGQMNVAMLQVIKHFLRHGIDQPEAVASGSSSCDDSSNCPPERDNINSSNGRSSSSSSACPSAANNSNNGSSTSMTTSSNSTGTRAAASADAVAGATSVTSADAAGNASTAAQQRKQQAGDECTAQPCPTAAIAEAPVVKAPYATTSSSLQASPCAAGETHSTTWPPYLDAGFSIRMERDSKSLTGVSDTQRSGCSSPTAASEYSVAASITSTSSAVPFSHIAYQRRQQKRELELHESAKRMLNDAAAAFDLRMDGYSLDLEALQQLNTTAADHYMVTAEIAAALGQFAQDLGSRQAAVREAIAALPQIDRQLKMLEATVANLDKRSRELESKVGLSGSSSSSKSAYEYLASSFSKASGTVGGVGAGGCLGGGALPKQFD